MAQDGPGETRLFSFKCGVWQGQAGDTPGLLPGAGEEVGGGQVWLLQPPDATAGVPAAPVALSWPSLAPEHPAVSPDTSIQACVLDFFCFFFCLFFVGFCF